MKTLVSMVLTLLLLSCSSSSGVPKLKKKTLKGTWEVTNVRFVGEQGTYKALLFDDADSACFKNSEWVFIPNNNTGKFTTAASNSQCEPVTEMINWSIYDNSQFQFKYTNGEKAKNVTSGYRSDIETLTDSTMVLKAKSTSNGKEFDIMLSFNKVSDDTNL